MKHLITLTAIVLGLNAHADRTVGNPGGGVVRSGVYMTFGSAGLLVDPTPVIDVPGLDLIRSVVDESGVPDRQKAQLWENILPYGARRYYDILTLDPQTYSKLVQEYSSLTKQPAGSIVIYAVTDPKIRTTYLLPEFYKLTKNDQAAILFHEGYWIRKPNASYLDVVSAEISFSKYLEARSRNQYDESLGQKLGILLDDPAIALNMGLTYDLKVKALDALGANASGLPLAAIVSPTGVDCEHREHFWADFAPTSQDLQLSFVYKLTDKYPKSYFLKALAGFFSPDSNGFKGTYQFEIETPSLNSDNCFGSLRNLNVRVKSVTVDSRSLMYSSFIK